MTGLFGRKCFHIICQESSFKPCQFLSKNKTKSKIKIKNQKMKKLEFYLEWKIPSKSIYRSRKFKNTKGIIAEAVSIDKVVQNKDGEYAVIIDRISQDVPLSCLP
jgi:hypothetical protein